MSDWERRYLAGEIDFETALSESVGIHFGRRDLADILISIREQQNEAIGLDQQDRTLLDAAGFTADRRANVQVLIDSAVRKRCLVETALSVEQAASVIGETPAVIAELVEERVLWAIDHDGQILLPAVQFTVDGSVPHIDRVLAAVGQDLHPLAVQGLLTEPNINLVIDGDAVSVIAWLISGADPQRAIDVALAERFEAI